VFDCGYWYSENRNVVNDNDGDVDRGVNKVSIDDVCRATVADVE